MRMAVKVTVALCALLFIGCAPPVLRMNPFVEPKDDTVVSPKLSSKGFQRVMIIPPSGTARAEFDEKVSLLEREFLKNELIVISGAITGRVVLDKPGGEGRRVEAAAQLSDAERALIMAKETGADVILQIGRMGWSQEQRFKRFFLLDGETYKEVSEAEFRTAPAGKAKYAFQSPVFTFVGRLMDVLTGEVIASFQMESAANWNLQSEYSTELREDSEATPFRKRRINETPFSYASGGWVAEVQERPETTMARSRTVEASGAWLVDAQERTESKVIRAIARRISGQ